MTCSVFLYPFSSPFLSPSISLPPSLFTYPSFSVPLCLLLTPFFFLRLSPVLTFSSLPSISFPFFLISLSTAPSTYPSSSTLLSLSDDICLCTKSLTQKTKCLCKKYKNYTRTTYLYRVSSFQMFIFKMLKKFKSIESFD